MPEVDPEKAPALVDEKGFGYAARFPGRKQRWHWMAADATRPSAPPKTGCNLFIGGAEIADWDKFLDGPSCPRCMRAFQRMAVVLFTRPNSKLDDDFKKSILKHRIGR